MISVNLTDDGRASSNCEAQLRRGAEPDEPLTDDDPKPMRPPGWPVQYEALFLFAFSFGWTAEVQANGSVRFTHQHGGSAGRLLRRPDMRVKTSS